MINANTNIVNNNFEELAGLQVEAYKFRKNFKI